MQSSASATDGQPVPATPTRHAAKSAAGDTQGAASASDGGPVPTTSTKRAEKATHRRKNTPRKQLVSETRKRAPRKKNLTAAAVNTIDSDDDDDEDEDADYVPTSITSSDSTSTDADDTMDNCAWSLVWAYYSATDTKWHVITMTPLSSIAAVHVRA